MNKPPSITDALSQMDEDLRATSIEGADRLLTLYGSLKKSELQTYAERAKAIRMIRRIMEQINHKAECLFCHEPATINVSLLTFPGPLSGTFHFDHESNGKVTSHAPKTSWPKLILVPDPALYNVHRHKTDFRNVATPISVVFEQTVSDTQMPEPHEVSLVLGSKWTDDDSLDPAEAQAARVEELTRRFALNGNDRR